MEVKMSSYSWYKMKIKLVPYAFIFPNLVIFTTFSIIPMFISIYYSMTRFDGLSKPTFIGLENYKNLIGDVIFLQRLGNTFTYAAISMFFMFILSLGIAIIMSQELKAKGLYRAAFYWPVMISATVVGVIWQWIFGDTIGLINNIRMAAGLPYMKTLSDPTFAKVIVIVATIWSRMGYYMIMFMGGIQSIPQSLYEAAKIDGASKWQTLRNITIPLLKPTSLMVIILMMMRAVREYPLVVTLTNGGPYGATTYAVQHIYETAFDMQRFGYASSMSVVMMVIVMIITFINFKASKGGEY